MSETDSKRTHLLLCDGPSCGVVHESERFIAQIAKMQAEDPNIAARVRVWSFTCFGLCDDGPNGYVCPSAIAPPSVNNAPAAKPGVAPPWPAVVPPSGPGGVQLNGLDEEAVERIVRELAARPAGG